MQSYQYFPAFKSKRRKWYHQETQLFFLCLWFLKLSGVMKKWWFFQVHHSSCCLALLTFSSISVHCWWSPKTAKMSGVLPYLSRILSDDSSKYFNIFCNLTWSPRMDAPCKTLNCGGRTCIWISFPTSSPGFSIFFFALLFLSENIDNSLKLKTHGVIRSSVIFYETNYNFHGVTYMKMIWLAHIIEPEVNTLLIPYVLCVRKFD